MFGRVCFLLSFAALLTRSAADNECVSYGMDFQHQGSYFQNSLSPDFFTFVSQFDGCQNDTAYNLLVDPQGEQYQCTDTHLTPDDTDQLSTCPRRKSELYSGLWSILIISNNGEEGDVIAYGREFSLLVGPQQTSTYTPTITETFVSTPIYSPTVTTTDTVTTTLPPLTITTPSTTVKPTQTITPKPVTTTITKNLIVITFTRYTNVVVKTTQTVTATCKKPTRPSLHDPTATVQPAVQLGVPLDSIFGAESKRSARILDREAYVKERSARAESAQLDRRAPDPQPLIVTEAETTKWQTYTTTSEAPTTTIPVTVGATTTATVTPPPVIVISGKTTAAAVTITAPAVTKTRTRYGGIGTTIVTKTRTVTYTIKTTTTPYPVKTSCAAVGGTLG